MKPAEYDDVASYKLPTIGGPMNDAMPWNSKSNPNALVSFSRPSKSTKITEVKPT